MAPLEKTIAALESKVPGSKLIDIRLATINDGEDDESNEDFDFALAFAIANAKRVSTAEVFE